MDAVEGGERGVGRDLERWLLPDGVEDVLPEQARALEHLRRRCLDLYAAHGFDLVIPPLLEFRASLLTGVGQDLALSTFTLVDQTSGHQLGLRADMTPQVARIDAHGRPLTGVARYCYAGIVLQARRRALGDRRCQMQMGCEIFGHAGGAADREILSLTLQSLQLAGCQRVVLELGHAGILRALLSESLLRERSEQLFAMLQRKAKPEIAAALVDEPQLRDLLLALVDGAGDRSVLSHARRLAVDVPAMQPALDELEHACAHIERHFPAVQIYIDLSELRGYRYHTGLIFAAYVEGGHVEVAKGGRYDDVGQAFGRARPATGFSLDLLSLSAFSALAAGLIWAPSDEDAELLALIDHLRRSGERVLRALPEETPIDAKMRGLDRRIDKVAGRWVVQPWHS